MVVTSRSSRVVGEPDRAARSTSKHPMGSPPKGGHQRLIPIAGRFFTYVAAYLEQERPADADTDTVFVVLKRPRRGQPPTAWMRSSTAPADGPV